MKILYTIIGGCNFFYRRLNKINILWNLGEGINPGNMGLWRFHGFCTVNLRICLKSAFLLSNRFFLNEYTFIQKKLRR